MRRKILNHFVKTIPDMFAGWRMREDLEKLSVWPDGEIYIDLLSGAANHSIAGSVDLHISKEITAWLAGQFKTEKLESEKIHGASLKVLINTGRIKTDKKSIVSFDFKMKCQIEADEKEYVAEKEDHHKWHSRIG